MNNTEKQADDLDWAAAPGNALIKLFSPSAASGLYNTVSGALQNMTRHGTVNPRPNDVAAWQKQQDVAKAQTAADAQRQAQQKIEAQKQQALGMGKDFYMYALGGLGTGIVLTRLQQILSGANKPKAKYTKFAPGPHGVDDEEKLAEDSVYTKIVSAPGRLIQALSGDANKNEWLLPLTLTGAGAGLYGGYSIMTQLAEQKRKADLQAKVEEAKKQYQKALMGKKVAADLDAAFALVEKRAEDGDNTATSAAAWLANNAFAPLRWPVNVMPWYLTGAVAAPGLLAAKMTYDWTRARSKDKALAEARKARARLAGSAPIYIDPEQLAAIKRVAG